MIAEPKVTVEGAVVPPSTILSTAVPQAITQILPQWFRDHPATTEAIWAYLYSAYLMISGILVFMTAQASVDGHMGTPLTLLAYYEHNWWAALVATVIIPVARGRQAYTKALKGFP